MHACKVTSNHVQLFASQRCKHKATVHGILRQESLGRFHTLCSESSTRMNPVSPGAPDLQADSLLSHQEAQNSLLSYNSYIMQYH